MAISSDVSRLFGILVWVPKLWHQKNTFQVFFFQLYFNKKYFEVAINDFAVHLIILKWLRRQKWKQKKNTKMCCQTKEEIVYECFHSFKYIVDHANVRFFLISLRTCSHSLNDISGLHCVVQFPLYHLLHLFSSDRFAALTSLYP